VAVVEDVAAAIGGRTSGYLLTGGEGGQWNGQSFSVSLRHHLKACGLDGRGYTAHTIRHSFATHLARAGVNIEDVSKLMRHKDVKTTMRYIHHDAGRLRDALDKHPLA
jgi:site-specific recombinase XerD